MDRSTLAVPFMPFSVSPPVEWVVSEGLTDYAAALDNMQRHVDAMVDGRACERVWLLEHPPLYTAGTSARDTDLAAARFPVHRTGRGGQYTYHGPGQRIAYVMLDLKRRRPDVRAFVAALESWVIAALATSSVVGERREDRVGVWVRRSVGPGIKDEGAEDKIAALGIRLRHWVSFHGVSINVAPDLSHYAGIVPCGITSDRYGVTSLAKLGVPAGMRDLDAALRESFEAIFGATVEVPGTALARHEGPQHPQVAL